MRLIVICTVLGFCVACSSPGTPSANTTSSQTIHTNAKDTIVINHGPLLQEGCYEMIMKRDTARLNFQIHDSVITGHLTYRWYSKDSNSGTIKGIIRDSIIEADYSFTSEGTTSVRTTAFKIRNGVLWQGFGDLHEKDNQITFKDKTRLQYDSIHPFIKVPCSPQFSR